MPNLLFTVGEPLGSHSDKEKGKEAEELHDIKSAWWTGEMVGLG